MERIRILYVTSNSRIGGAENFILRLVRQIKKVMPEFILDCLITHETGGLHSQYEEAFDNVIVLKDEDLEHNLNTRMIEFFESNKHKYDIVQAIDNFHTMANMASIFSNQIRFIQCFYLDITRDIYSKSIHWKTMIEHGMKYWRAVIAMMENNVKTLSSPLKEPHILRSINNCVDTDYWIPGEKEENKVCWVGRITKDKGADMLMELIRMMPDIQFHVVANEAKNDRGFLHDEFMALLQSQSIRNLIYEWSISPEELLKVYQSSRVYLHTSYSEAQPTTLLEAMSCGCIPICGDVGGISEIVKPSDGGIMIDMAAKSVLWDFIDAIKIAVKANCSDRLRRRVVEEFNIENETHKYIAVYKEIFQKI